MAKVSGPGKYARRVDGTAFDKNATRQPIREMPSQEYGDRAEMTGLQGSAPMSATPSMQPMPRPTPLSAPTQRPQEPITTGAPFGPGFGREVMPIPPAPEDETANLVRALYALNPDPDLARLIQRLDFEGR
jgi:hypothetical protein